MDFPKWGIFPGFIYLSDDIKNLDDNIFYLRKMELK